MSGGKLWGLFQTKDVILANSENWANIFLEFSLKFLFSLSKLLHSSRSEKNIVEKVFFFEKTHFFRSFPAFYQKFQDLPPFFVIRVVKRAFPMSRRTLPSKLYFLSQKILNDRFSGIWPNNDWTFCLFFNGDVKIAVKVSRTYFRGKIFWKKSFLKFSIRHWGRLFETTGENFAAGFSKLHFSCPEGNLKQKNILFKTFLQDFCEFQQSNFWTFSKFFFRQFCGHYIFRVQIIFLRESPHDQLNHRSKQYVTKQINNLRKWKNFSDFWQNFLNKLVKTAF